MVNDIVTTKEKVLGTLNQERPTLLDPERPEHGSVFSFRTDGGVLHVNADLVEGGPNEYVDGVATLEGPRVGYRDVTKLQKPNS